MDEQSSSCLADFYRVPEVVYTTYNMGTWDLPDIYACTRGPQYIRQIPRTHVITITNTLATLQANVINS